MQKDLLAAVLALLTYDPTTGTLAWRVDRGKCKAGRVVTCRNGSGYIVVRVNDTLVRAHRAAWAITHGKWPDTEIDHINGVKDDNRLANLREATRAQNMQNLRTPATNKSGFKGVSWHKAAGKWQAHIRADGHNYYLGLFDSPENAHAKYREAAVRLHEQFSNHQKRPSG